MEKVKIFVAAIACFVVGAVVMYAGVSFGSRHGQTQTEPAVTQVTETEVEAPAAEDVEQPAEAVDDDRTEATAPEAVDDDRTEAEVDRTETPDSFVDDGQNEGSTAAMSDVDYTLKGYVVYMEMNSIGYAFESEDAKWVSQNIGDDSSWCRGLEAALKGSAIPTPDGPVFYCDGKTAADFALAWGGAKVYVMPSGTNTWALAKAAMASAEEVDTCDCPYGTYTVYAQ